MKKEIQSDCFYVVLVRALTGLGKFARWVGRYDYTHVAVCFDEPFDKFYTFSRRKHNAPFDCGYMVETLDCYAFGKHRNVRLKVFKVPVTKETKEKIVAYVETVSKDPAYLFNLYAMATMPILHGFNLRKAHTCMSFVGKILALSGSVAMSKPYYKYNLREMDELLGDYLYTEGLFDKKKTETAGYMDRVGAVSNTLSFIRLNGKLLYRLIAKGNREDEQQF